MLVSGAGNRVTRDISVLPMSCRLGTAASIFTYSVGPSHEEDSKVSVILCFHRYGYIKSRLHTQTVSYRNHFFVRDTGTLIIISVLSGNELNTDLPFCTGATTFSILGQSPVQCKQFQITPGGAHVLRIQFSLLD